MAYLDESIKKLGSGLVRLPMIGNEVNIKQTKQMVDLFLSKGFTYFDTAYGYLDGKSEATAKTALIDRYPREQFQLATKLPVWAGSKTAQEARDMFWTSLERTGARYFDFYLLHNRGDNRTQSFNDFGIWDFLAEQKQQQRIRSLGFSFHDKATGLDELLTQHPEMDFVQLQINYADWQGQLSLGNTRRWPRRKMHSMPPLRSRLSAAYRYCRRTRRSEKALGRRGDFININKKLRSSHSGSRAVFLWNRTLRPSYLRREFPAKSLFLWPDFSTRSSYRPRTYQKTTICQIRPM